MYVHLCIITKDEASLKAGDFAALKSPRYIALFEQSSYFRTEAHFCFSELCGVGVIETLSEILVQGQGAIKAD